MKNTNDTKREIDDTSGELDTRRQFLKKAGIATGAALALYVVPTITTVGASPAYATLTGPRIPKLQPPNGATFRPNQQMVFQWDPVDGARTYQVELWRGESCDGTKFPGVARTSRNVLITPAPTVLGPISWRVTAFDTSGNIVNTSDCCWFKVTPTGT